MAEIKLSYNVTITVDAEAWTEYYGTRPAVDICELILNTLRDFSYVRESAEPRFTDVEVKIPVEITVVPPKETIL